MNLVMQNWSLYYNQLIENDLGPDNLKKYENQKTQLLNETFVDYMLNCTDMTVIFTSTRYQLFRSNHRLFFDK